MTNKRPPFGYNPETLERELLPAYIGASKNDINEMLQTIGATKLEDMFNHIPNIVLGTEVKKLGPALSYSDLADHLFELSQKNKMVTSFIGDGLAHFAPTDIVGEICSIRGLTTAYTPYQPERSQGTLQSLWLYQCALSELTGLEAINASLYDRATCLHEALNTSTRLKKGSHVVVIDHLYPGDKEVIKTMAAHTDLKIHFAPLDLATGLTDIDELKKLIEKTNSIAVAFSQVNHLGLLEDVHTLTDLCSEMKLISIAIIDPMLLTNQGLVPPTQFGKNGADIVVGEGQHLALDANFGGPGLGIFGIRYNESNKNNIRSTPGRFVGKGTDLTGKVSKSLVLSTREQHIRRDKATSNICSNQSFLATLAAANLVYRGTKGLTESILQARHQALKFANEILSLAGVKLAFPQSLFFNELTLELNIDVTSFLASARSEGMEIGVDVSNRLAGKKNLLKISFYDRHTDQEVANICDFFKQQFPKSGSTPVLQKIDQKFLRSTKIEIPNHSKEEVISYFKKLGEQNLTPDDGIYPLGSCTMKYNPYINDWAAGLEGFTKIHPQAHPDFAQGSLELLFCIQKDFSLITGLPGVTTQPVAGAQGELVGLKMFQAYHDDRGEGKTRQILLIPESAHGTNPATATMAGYTTKIENAITYGIHPIKALPDGTMNVEQVREMVEKYGEHIAGMMVTNPNTSGIFEINFKKVADLIHSVGGLVYMDGANMNAIAGHVNLEKLGVDAVHNNLHKTWTIPHGGGGPGDAIVAVSEKLVDYLPGMQIKFENNKYTPFVPKKSIGSIHRHWGNFAHKVRCYTYLKALGGQGVLDMSSVAVLSARYLFEKLKFEYPTLPVEAQATPRMHEFIITLTTDLFKHIESKGGVPKANIIARVGKLFLDFGFHSPTVAFPEAYGLMVEPTESYSKKELDDFCNVIREIFAFANEHPEVLKTVPHFTPINRVDEVAANKNLVLSEKIGKTLPEIYPDRVRSNQIKTLAFSKVKEMILKSHLEMMQEDIWK